MRNILQKNNNKKQKLIYEYYKTFLESEIFGNIFSVPIYQKSRPFSRESLRYDSPGNFPRKKILSRNKNFKVILQVFFFIFLSELILRIAKKPSEKDLSHFPMILLMNLQEISTTASIYN